MKILIDPKAVLFLLGTEMDYKADKMQAQFIFNNPNQVSACGCGESVQLTAGEGLRLSTPQPSSLRSRALARRLEGWPHVPNHPSRRGKRRGQPCGLTSEAVGLTWTAIS